MEGELGRLYFYLQVMKKRSFPLRKKKKRGSCGEKLHENEKHRFGNMKEKGEEEGLPVKRSSAPRRGRLTDNIPGVAEFFSSGGEDCSFAGGGGKGNIFETRRLNYFYNEYMKVYIYHHQKKGRERGGGWKKSQENEASQSRSSRRHFPKKDREGKRKRTGWERAPERGKKEEPVHLGHERERKTFREAQEKTIEQGGREPSLLNRRGGKREKGREGGSRRRAAF